jgi:YVTN family beta-propeller protein
LAQAFAASFLVCLPTRADEAFVTNQSSNDVSVVDLMTKQVVATIPIGGAPAGIAMAADGRRAYVTSPEGKFVSVIDNEARQVVAKIAVEGPLGIAVDPIGAFVYVADFFSARLVKIDPRSNTIIATLGVGAAPCGIVVTPDGGTIVVADRDDDQISIIDAKTFTRRATVKVGKHPFGLAVDSAGKYVYTANVEGDDVSAVDLEVLRLVGSAAVGKRPYGIALAKGRGFTTDQYGGTVSVFDLASLQPLKRIPVGDYPEGIEASADGRTIYVTNWFSNELWVVDAGELIVVAKIAVGDGPRAFGMFLRRVP